MLLDQVNDIVIVSAWCGCQGQALIREEDRSPCAPRWEKHGLCGYVKHQPDKKAAYVASDALNAASKGPIGQLLLEMV